MEENNFKPAVPLLSSCMMLLTRLPGLQMSVTPLTAWAVPSAYLHLHRTLDPKSESGRAVV